MIQIVSQFLTRSVGVDLSNGSMMYEYKTSLEQGHSIAAVNSEGKILGVRIGVILHRWSDDAKLQGRLRHSVNLIPRAYFPLRCSDIEWPGVAATLGSQKISSNCSTSSHAACLSGWTPSRCFPHKCWSLNNDNDNENDNDNNQWTWDKQSASVDETLLGVRCWWFCWRLENDEELIKAMPMMAMIVTT